MTELRDLVEALADPAQAEVPERRSEAIDEAGVAEQAEGEG